jgi:hypothetical protein
LLAVQVTHQYLLLSRFYVIQTFVF